MIQPKQNNGMVLATVLFLLLLTGLAALAFHVPTPLNQLSEILLRAHRYQDTFVVIEGTVRNLYSSNDVRNRSFDLLSDNQQIAIRSGRLEFPPRNSKVRVYGHFQPKQSSPYVVEHIELQRLEPAARHVWFMELDRRAHGIR